MITLQELNLRKKWPLSQKIDHSLGVIDQFYSFNKGLVYVGFSGGKDSSVLLHLIRRVFDKECLGVFCNTGNEFPDIIKFVRSVSNVQIIRPQYTVKQIIDQYGFPLISKEQSKYIREAKHTKNEQVYQRRMFGKRGSAFQGCISDKWKFLTKAPFEVSERCCEFLKKSLFINLKKKQTLSLF